MYSINDKVVDKAGKAYTIESIAKKNFGNGDEDYFIMKPCFDYDFNKDYRCFIPVAKQDTLLRPVIDKEYALKLIDSLPSLLPYGSLSAKDKKSFFQSVVSSGDLPSKIRVIKTISKYKAERKKLNKPISDFDSRLLTSLTSIILDELSLSLCIEPKEVEDLIAQRTGRSLYF